MIEIKMKPTCPTCNNLVTEIDVKKGEPQTWECDKCGELTNPNYKT
jgi:ribosomal protein L37AE/L43A